MEGVVSHLPETVSEARAAIAELCATSPAFAALTFNFVEA